MSALGDLVVRVGGDIAGFADAMRDVEAFSIEAMDTVGESMESATESVAKFAEGSQVAMGSAISAIGGLTAVLGGGALVAVMGELVEKTQENVLEFSHLSEATGVSIAHLAELKATLQDLGTSGENFDKVLTKLSRSIVEAGRGQKEQVQSLNALGVSTKNWGAELPKADDVLLQISDHMARSKDATRDLGNASLVLGRDVIGLIGALKEGKEALQAHMKANEDFGKAIEDAAPSVRQLTALEAQLSHAWQGLAATVLPAVTIAVKVLGSAFYGVQAILKNVIDAIWSTAKAINDGLWGPIKAVIKLAHGDLKGAQLAMGEAGVKMSADLAEGGQKMVNAWGKATESVKALWAAVKEGKETGGANIVDETSKNQKGKAPKLPKDDYKQIEELTERIARNSEEIWVWQQKWSTEMSKAGQAIHKEALEPLEIQVPLWQRMTTAVREAYLNVQAVTKAYKDMGITSTATLVEAASEAKRNYDLMKNSGIAAAHDILAAHVAMLQARQAAEVATGEKITAIEKTELEYLKKQLAELGQHQADNGLLKNFVASFNLIGRSFGGTIDKLLDGTLRFKKAWSNLGRSILSEFTENLVHMAAAWAGHLAKELAIKVLTNLTMKASDQEMADAGVQIHLLAHLKKLLIDAKGAAAGAFRGVMDTVPFPLDVVLAPIAAAAAFTGVMALGAVSAEHGAMLPNHNTLGFLHPNEMVLPAGISAGLQRLIASGAGGGSTMNVTQHITSNHGQSAAEIANIAISGIRKAVRNNHGRIG